MSIHNDLAPTPPMGWNSWDCFGLTLHEHELRRQAEFMAAELHRHGWEYLVIDANWYEHSPQSTYFGAHYDVALDEYGRLAPTPDRFPSAAGGAGFKPLADYVHSLGLKFGFHIFRGIPRRAVREDLPIFGGGGTTAREVADKQAACSWCGVCWGLDVSRPGGQAYYDSLMQLYAQWGVDFIKADDMCNPYRAAEIEALSAARDTYAPELVLSFSASVKDADPQTRRHVVEHGEMWRITRDFWDEGPQLREQFRHVRVWEGASGPGHWADADMLPIGELSIRHTAGGEHRTSRLTEPELRTMLTLWGITQSPLMIGGRLTTLSDRDLSLLTNRELIDINQHGEAARLLFDHGRVVAWTNRHRGTGDVFLALFNTHTDGDASVDLAWADLGLEDVTLATEAWTRDGVSARDGRLRLTLPAADARLIRLATARVDARIPARRRRIDQPAAPSKDATYLRVDS